MRYHYLKGRQLADAKSTLLDSGTWKWIINSRVKTLQFMSNTDTHPQSSDTWTWTLTKTSMFEFKSAWEKN